MVTDDSQAPPARHDDAPDRDTNPWMLGLAYLGAATIIAGIIAIGINSDPTDFDYNPTWAAVGEILLGTGILLMCGFLVAGAVAWELRRR